MSFKYSSKIVLSVFVFATILQVSPCVSARTVSVMAYNVDNLFDSFHDEGKKDYTYLPLSEKQKGSDAYKYCKSLAWNRAWMRECFDTDWTYEVFYQKLRNIAQVVRSFGEGVGADIVMFEEVEKVEILQSMIMNELADLGYVEAVLIEGEDKRGIDVGVISKFPLAGESILHPVNLNVLSKDYLEIASRAKSTRGILEVPLDIDGRKVTVLGNHWPSPGSKPITRMIAGRNLRTVLESMPKDSLVIAAGDFNVVEEEYPNGIETHLTKTGPNGYFVDIYSECQHIDGPFCTYPPGTAYYRGWDRLDRMFFSDTFLKDDSVEFSWADFMVYAPSFIIDGKNRPVDYEPKTGRGYSDHLPVAMEFEID